MLHKVQCFRKTGFFSCPFASPDAAALRFHFEFPRFISNITRRWKVSSDRIALLRFANFPLLEVASAYQYMCTRKGKSRCYGRHYWNFNYFSWFAPEKMSALSAERERPLSTRKRLLKMKRSFAHDFEMNPKNTGKTAGETFRVVFTQRLIFVSERKPTVRVGTVRLWSCCAGHACARIHQNENAITPRSARRQIEVIKEKIKGAGGGGAASIIWIPRGFIIAIKTKFST